MNDPDAPAVAAPAVASEVPLPRNPVVNEPEAAAVAFVADAAAVPE